MLQYHENGVFKLKNKLKGFKCDVCLKVFSSNSMDLRDYKKHTSELFARKICDKNLHRKLI